MTEEMLNRIDELTKEVDRIANDTSFNEEIYPLKGKGLSAADLDGKIGLSFANLKSNNENLDEIHKKIVKNPLNTRDRKGF